jgi:hypothetical protein
MKALRHAAALLALALLLPLSAKAQEDEKIEKDVDVDLIVSVGYQGSFLKDFTAFPGDRKVHSGVRAGLQAAIRLYEIEDDIELGLRPGLFFSQKGESYSDHSYHLNYIDLPVLIAAKYEMKDDLSLIGGVGPYFGVGLYGKNEIGKASGEHDAFGEDGEMKRFDCGISADFGLEYDDCRLTIGGQYGFVNQLKDPAPAGITGTPKNASFFVMLGYSF